MAKIGGTLNLNGRTESSENVNQNINNNSNKNENTNNKFVPLRRNRLNSLISSEDSLSKIQQSIEQKQAESRSSLSSEKKNRLKSEYYQHNFIDKTFSSPRECKLCGKFIWVVNSGSQCSQCDYSAHKHCKEEATTFGCSGVKGCFEPFYILKLAILGPSNSGKKSLAMSHTGIKSLTTKKETPTLYYRSMTRLYDKREFGVEIFTLPASKNGFFERLDILKEVDLTFLCFSVSDQNLLENSNSLEVWKKEIVSESRHPLFILVGLKADLREEKDNISKFPLISRELGEKYSKELGALKYMECSSITKVGVNNLFYWGVAELVKRLDMKQK